MHKHHKHKEAKAGQHGVPGPAAEVKTPEPRAHNQAPEENEEHASPRADGSAKFQWANIVLQFFILAVTAAILWVYYMQLQSMLASNELTRRSLVETKNSNESSSRTAERALKLTEESNRLTREALEESKRQSEASRKQSAADAEASRIQSAKDAAANLRMVRNSLEVSERARLGIEGISPYAWRADQTGSATVMVKNAGRSPAIDVRGVIFAQARLASLPPLEAIGRPSGSQSRSVIPPEATQSVTITMPTLTAEQLDALKRGDLVLYVVGRFLYKDSFGHSHSTRFCSSHEMTGDGWSLCPGGNQAD